MAHDGDDRRTGLERLRRILIAGDADFDVGFGDAIDAVAEFLDQQFGGVLIDRFRDGYGHAELEQGFDQVGAALTHALGEFLDRDRFRHRDVAILLGCRAGLLMVASFLFARALERGHRTRTGAAVAVGEGAGNRELAGLASIVAAAASRPGRFGLLGRRSMLGTAMRSEEHTSELQSLMRISYAVFCL